MRLILWREEQRLFSCWILRWPVCCLMHITYIGPLARAWGFFFWHLCFEGDVVGLTPREFCRDLINTSLQGLRYRVGIRRKVLFFTSSNMHLFILSRIIKRQMVKNESHVPIDRGTEALLTQCSWNSPLLWHLRIASFSVKQSWNADSMLSAYLFRYEGKSYVLYCTCISLI